MRRGKGTDPTRSLRREGGGCQGAIRGARGGRGPGQGAGGGLPAPAGDVDGLLEGAVVLQAGGGELGGDEAVEGAVGAEGGPLEAAWGGGRRVGCGKQETLG